MARRPLYGELAWLHDSVVEPAGPSPADVLRLLGRGSAGDGATVVDAGCGAGRYALALARAGLSVTGIDASAELVEVARRAARAAGVELELRVGDLRDWRPQRPADAVVCCDVLHELVDEAARGAALAGLAAMLRGGGDLVVDVRERDASLARCAEPRGEEAEPPLPDHRVRYRSETRAERETGLLRVRERVEVTSRAGTQTIAGEATLRPWTAGELEAGLRAAGFASIELLPAGATAAGGDRLVAVARRG